MALPNADHAGEACAWTRLAAEAAATFGTPCYLSRWRPVERTTDSLERRFTRTPARSWLSFKTHPVRQLASEWIRSGRGVEVVSEYEFAALRALGCPTDQLLVNGVAKHAWLMRYVVPGLRVHFDSVEEARALLSVAVEQRWRIGLRCHVPSERDGKDPKFGGQFGLSGDEVVDTQARLRSAGVEIEGLHFHLGQSERSAGAYDESMEYLAGLCARTGMVPRYVDCGGGIDANPDVDAAIDGLVSSIEWLQRRLPSPLIEVWLENGRYLTRSSAALVVRVLDVKDRKDSRYLICDGGRTNHALDADNGPHRVLVVPARAGRQVLTTIAGPTCMTDDRLARLMLPDTVVAGDAIVWLDAGAYYLPWETRFSQGLCAVVWADRAETLSLARARETPEQWSALWIETS